MTGLSSAEWPVLKELVLWVTTDCNLRCRYCYAGGGDEPEYMDWPVARQALDIMICQSSGFKVQFAGGEPLLNMDLIEQVVRYTQGRGAVYQLQTNATLIDAGIAGSLKRLGIDVGVSLDGLPAVNDPLRPFANGQGSTMSTITGLKNLRAAGIIVGLTCVLSAENVASLSSLVELAGYLGNVGGITFDMLRPIGRATREEVQQADPALAACCVTDALRRADEMSLMGGNRVRFREVERMNYVLTHGKRRRHRCYFDAGQLLMVKPNGDSYPCASATSFPEFYLGNIMEPTFVEDLGDNLQRCRDLIAPPQYCFTCSEHGLCARPCPVQTYAQQLTGKTNPVECSTKKAFINYIKRKEVRNHAANQVSLPV